MGRRNLVPGDRVKVLKDHYLDAEWGVKKGDILIVKNSYSFSRSFSGERTDGKFPGVGFSYPKVIVVPVSPITKAKKAKIKTILKDITKELE